jgi:hypothetical protein
MAADLHLNHQSFLWEAERLMEHADLLTALDCAFSDAWTRKKDAY